MGFFGNDFNKYVDDVANGKSTTEPEKVYSNPNDIANDIAKNSRREEFIKQKIMEQVELNSTLSNNKMLASIRGSLADIPEISNISDDELTEIILNWKLKNKNKR